MIAIVGAGEAPAAVQEIRHHHAVHRMLPAGCRPAEGSDSAIALRVTSKLQLPVAFLVLAYRSHANFADAASDHAHRAIRDRSALQRATALRKLAMCDGTGARFGAYALLGSLFCLTYPDRITFVCLLVLGSAVFLELLQILVPGRDAGILDAFEKLAGGVVGISIARAVLTFVSRRGWRR